MTKTDDRWHLTKGVSLAHIGSTLVLASALFGYAITQDQRLTRVEERSVMLDQRIDREVTRTADDLAVIRQSVQRMEDRLERLTDGRRER